MLSEEDTRRFSKVKKEKLEIQIPVFVNIFPFYYINFYKIKL